MRNSPNLALCLAVLPLLAAAKPLLDNEGHAFLTEQVLGGRAAGTSQQFQFRTARWGPAASGGGANELRMNDSAGGAAAGVDVQRKDLVAEDRMGNAPAAGGHSMLGASDKTAIHDPPPPRDGGLGSESELTAASQVGPRQTSGRYLTLRPRPYGSGPGTLVIEGVFPACMVGKRYGGMQFASGGMRYELQDVVISNCPAAAAPKEEVTFVYGKVKVRAWDPKKKED
jgi:hypothetical protein